MLNDSYPSYPQLSVSTAYFRVGHLIWEVLDQLTSENNKNTNKISILQFGNAFFPDILITL